MSNDGFALVISLVLLLLLTVLGVSLLAVSGLESNISHNDQWTEGALHAAEAGVHAAIDQLGVDPASSTTAIPETTLLADYSYRSGSRHATAPEPLQFLGKLNSPGFGISVGTGYNPSGFSFSRYQINATGIAPRNNKREVEALADYGPFPE